MSVDIKIVEEAKTPFAMHPKKFALWLFIASAFMIFAALSSAYIVRRANGNWLKFDLPELFWVTSAIVLCSSITMHLAYRAAKHNHQERLRLMMILTGILGIAFLVGQIYAAGDLIANRIHLSSRAANAVSGSFLYIIAGLHWFHIVSGVIVIGATSISVFRNKVNSNNLLGIEMCATYWHFLDVLWLYLFVFLLLYR